MAETKPTEYRYGDGRVQILDPAIAAGLLALDGAAWDGKAGFVFPDDAGYSAAVARGGVRVLRIALADSHVELVEVLLQSDYHDRETGKTHKAGERAPVPRVFFHLAGGYEHREGSATVRTRWVEDDYREWYRRWFAPGGQFVVRPRQFAECRNRLLDRMRDNHGAGKRKRMEVAGV